MKGGGGGVKSLQFQNQRLKYEIFVLQSGKIFRTVKKAFIFLRFEQIGFKLKFNP